MKKRKSKNQTEKERQREFWHMKQGYKDLRKGIPFTQRPYDLVDELKKSIGCKLRDAQDMMGGM